MLHGNTQLTTLQKYCGALSQPQEQNSHGLQSWKQKWFDLPIKYRQFDAFTHGGELQRTQEAGSNKPTSITFLFLCLVENMLPWLGGSALGSTLGLHSSRWSWCTAGDRKDTLASLVWHKSMLYRVKKRRKPLVQQSEPLRKDPPGFSCFHLLQISLSWSGRMHHPLKWENTSKLNHYFLSV